VQHIFIKEKTIINLCGPCELTRNRGRTASIREFQASGGQLDHAWTAWKWGAL